MKSTYNSKAHKRIIILVFFFLLWQCGLIFRLIHLQVFEHTNLKEEVHKHNQNIKPIYPKRGTIYDRTGNILARSIPRQSVFYSPSEKEPLSQRLEKLDKLKEVLDLSENEIKKIQARMKKNSSFIWIKRKIDPTKEEEVNKLSLRGVYFLEENKRFYPQGKLAAHLLGRVNIDDIGASGIELKFNSYLEGEKGKYLILKDAKKRRYRFEILKEPKPGKNLILTIDETIQYYAEKGLEKAMHETGANQGTIIISKPSTGEILAMANYPTWDLNRLPPMPSKLDRNGAIHHTFEPGSTFKIITASTALETGNVSLTDTFDCSKGSIKIAKWTIRDHKRFGLLSFPEVIIHSSNVGTIQVSRHIREDTLYRTIKNFGFGQKTGIDLPAEEKGILRPLNDWSGTSTASLSIGYEISVTAIQMLQTINIVANRGLLIPPKIVKKIHRSHENPIISRFQHRRIISKETALNLSSILKEAVRRGTGIAAQIKGYKIAGKTGTAKKFDFTSGSYSNSSYTASFAGFVPADNPALSMIVVIDEPKDQFYGGQVAAPIFGEVARQILRYLHIPQQDDSQETVLAEKSWRQTAR